VPVGGAIGEFSSWRVVFWINIPICVIGTAGLIYALHLYQEISSLRSKLARIDYFGMGIFVASTTLMLCGLTTGGTTHPWKSASVLAPLILGLTGLGVFVLVEWKVAKHQWSPFESSQIEPPMQGISAHSYTALCFGPLHII
jgi:MFS family permease